jgi:hypothetical protein
MAGLGRKVFTAGDVLTASDVQNYLMDQSVMVFAGTAARSSAIATPTTGMTTYIGTTPPQLETYTGAAYQSLSGLTLVASTTFSAAATMTFTNAFSSQFNNYLIVLDGSVSGTLIQISYKNANAGTPTTLALYEYIEIYSNNANNPSNYAGGLTTAYHAFDGGTMTSSGTFYVFDPFLASPTRFQAHSFGYSSTTSFSSTQGGGRHSPSTSYDGFVLATASGTFTGDVRVYGLRSS